MLHRLPGTPTLRDVVALIDKIERYGPELTEKEASILNGLVRQYEQVEQAGSTGGGDVYGHRLDSNH